MKRIYKTPLLKSQPVEKKIGIDSLAKDIADQLIKTGEPSPAASTVFEFRDENDNNNARNIDDSALDDLVFKAGANISHMGSWSGISTGYTSRGHNAKSTTPVAESTTYIGSWTRIATKRDSSLLNDPTDLFVPVGDSVSSVTNSTGIIDVLTYNIVGIQPGKHIVKLILPTQGGIYPIPGNTQFESFFPASKPPIYWESANYNYYIGSLWDPIEGSDVWSSQTELAVPKMYGKKIIGGIPTSIITTKNIQSSFSIQAPDSPSSVDWWVTQDDYNHDVQHHSIRYRYDKDAFVGTSDISGNPTGKNMPATIVDNPLTHVECFFDTDDAGNEILVVSNPTVYVFDGTITVVGI